MTDIPTIDELNGRFGIAGIAQVLSGNGGLAKLRITAGAASAEIYLHGAQVTSWLPAGAEEVLFLSRQSRWKNGSAIRGGIPICFPWFRGKRDNAQAPAHGFVRTRAWELDSVSEQADGAVTATFSTGSDDSTRQWWPHEFRLTHRITAGRTLGLTLTAANAGATAFSFEEALHTYFRVGDAGRVHVRGLDQVRYLDNTDANRAKVQSGDVLFAAATDNAYLDAHGPAGLIDPALRRTLSTEKDNSATTVVWNPWQQGAAALSDLGDEEWREMACVEACNILNAAITLAPGERHTMGATLAVSAD
jgi:glucose-6-phosphate 1-epimerase